MLTQKWYGKIWKKSACVILYESRNAFTIECRLNEFHLELIHGIFLWFPIHMELFSLLLYGIEYIWLKYY